jgi:hypothetical protein
MTNTSVQLSGRESVCFLGSVVGIYYVVAKMDSWVSGGVHERPRTGSNERF